MENKIYYTPDISDIRVGYECEQYSKITVNGEYDISPEDGVVVSDYQWRPYKFRKFTFSYKNLQDKLVSLEGNLMIGDLSNYRTPYLTKEQIEAEGWKFIPLEYSEGKWQKNNYVLNTYGSTHIIEIGKYLSNKDKWYTVFMGECKSLNELRYISKLLNIE